MTLLLVDGTNLGMRSIHAMSRSGLSSDGVATGALVAFVNSLAMHVRQEHPHQVAVCWDGGHSAYRLGLDPGYKSGRPGPTGRQAELNATVAEVKEDVFTLTKEFCSLANVFHVERPEVEADDLIASYWRDYRAERHEDDKVVILSSDKDFLQLVGTSPSGAVVEQVRLSSAGTSTDRWTAARVATELRCRPEQVPMVMALTGDNADSIPGIRGFGPRTATKILAEADYDFDRALEHERVAPYAERVRLNLALVDLRHSLPGLQLGVVPRFRPTAPGDGSLYLPLLDYLVRYRLRQVQARLYDGLLWHQRA